MNRRSLLKSIASGFFIASAVGLDRVFVKPRKQRPETPEYVINHGKHDIYEWTPEYGWEKQYSAFDDMVNAINHDTDGVWDYKMQAKDEIKQ